MTNTSDYDHARTDHNNTSYYSYSPNSELSAKPLPWYMRNGSVRPVRTMVNSSGQGSLFYFLVTIANL